MRRYKAEITRAAWGYNIMITSREDGLWMGMEVGRYWALTRSGARAKAQRIMRRRRRADAREAAAETMTDPPTGGDRG